MNSPPSHARASSSHAKEHLRKMSTSAQIAANRANSQLSTGPKTKEGKAASSRNRITHGLATDRTLSRFSLTKVPKPTTSCCSHSSTSTVPKPRPRKYWSRAWLGITGCVIGPMARDKLLSGGRLARRKAQSGNWVRIAKARERGAHPQTREARHGEGTPYVGGPARRSKDRTSLNRGGSY